MEHSNEPPLPGTGCAVAAWDAAQVETGKKLEVLRMYVSLAVPPFSLGVGVCSLKPSKNQREIDIITDEDAPAPSLIILIR